MENEILDNIDNEAGINNSLEESLTNSSENKTIQDKEIQEINESFQKIRKSLSKRILGQEKLVDRLLIALLAHGHLLVEGAPGLAKTMAIKALSKHIEGDFNRIQFTPDLLPSDLTGTEIYKPQTAEFEFQKGPLFHNLILADEVNRAPAKVQSALLEAMGEQQITVGKTTYKLPKLFMVMATQNPIEQEGTYPLPEAQLDRFLMHIKIDYPDPKTELGILKLSQNIERNILNNSEDKESFKITQEQITKAQSYLFDIYISENLEKYLVELILATRTPEKYSVELADKINFGGSPRATISLDKCARANAFLNNRDYVTPNDIHTVIADVLRHRIILSFEAEAEGITTDMVIEELLELVPLP